MIDKSELLAVVNSAIEGTDLFVVELTVSTDNVVDIALDSMSSVSIDDCMRVDRAVHDAFDTDVDDYALTVGSYGITSPLLVRRQYDKNIGQQVEVLTNDGRKMHGTLTKACDDDFTITVPTKVKVEGKKKPEIQPVEHVMHYSEVKYTKCEIKVGSIN